MSLSCHANIDDILPVIAGRWVILNYVPESDVTVFVRKPDGTMGESYK